MLTVDFDRLDLRPGQRLLDLGAGGGRHAYEAFRRGANVVALDRSHQDLVGVAGLLTAMADAGEAPPGVGAGCMTGDALTLPFADGTFDRIICSEVLEHITDDGGAIAEIFRVLKPGGTLAATVPAWLPEKICWLLSAEFHAPLAVGGHVRIYTESELKSRLSGGGFEVSGSHKAHALHSPYWILKCIVGPTNDANPLVKAYHRLLVWDIAKAPAATRVPERLLNPLVGKSIVVYCRKPVLAAPGARTRQEASRAAA